MGLYGCEYSAENVFISVYKNKTIVQQASYDVSRVTWKFQHHVWRFRDDTYMKLSYPGVGSHLGRVVPPNACLAYVWNPVPHSSHYCAPVDNIWQV